MTIIKMLESRKGTEDGFTIRQFEAGKIYDIRENLARTMNANGWATTKLTTEELDTFKIEKRRT